MGLHTLVNFVGDVFCFACVIAFHEVLPCFEILLC